MIISFSYGLKIIANGWAGNETLPKAKNFNTMVISLVIYKKCWFAYVNFESYFERSLRHVF